MKGAWSILLGSFALLVPHMAQAEQVRLLSDMPAPFNRRIAAEIASVGLTVDTTGNEHAPPTPDMVAVLRMVEEPPRVEVWLVDASRRLQLASVIDIHPDVDMASDVVRIAEHIRALLQPVAERVKREEAIPTPEPPPDESPIEAPTEAPIEAPIRRRPVPEQRDVTRRAWVELGGTGVWQVEQMSLSAHVGAGAIIADPLTIHGFVGIPVTEGVIEREGAEASIAASWMGAGLGLRMGSGTLRFQPSCGLGAAWVRSVGQASPPLHGRDTETVVALPYAAFDLLGAVGEGVWLGGGVMAGVAQPRVDIEFDDTHVGTWGRPLVTGRLFVALDI